MKYILSFIIFSLILHVSQANGQVTVLSGQELSKEAEVEWNDMPDRTNPIALDGFIKKYPATPHAALAFATRYSLISQNPDIRDYNAFIKTYPDRLQAQLAIQEVFELYRQQHRVTGYVDFLNQHPNSQQAMVAKLHLQNLMFEWVALLNEVEVYDDFIKTFPDAPQVATVAGFAEKRELELRKQEYEELEKKSSNRLERDSYINEKANLLAAEWETWMTQYVDKYLQKNITTIAPEDALPFFKIARHEKILLTYYGGTNTAGRVRSEKRHQELMKKLNRIQETMIANHKELVSTIREESAKIREELKKGFERIHLDNQKTQELLGNLERGMNRLHDSIEKVYGELVNIRGDLALIHAEMQKANQKLDNLDENLRQLNQNVVAIYDTINENFTQQNELLERNFQQMGDKIDTMKDELGAKLDDIYNVGVKNLEATWQLSDQMANFQQSMEGRMDTMITNQAEQIGLQRDTVSLLHDANTRLGHLQQGQERLIGYADLQSRITADIAKNQVRTLNSLEAFRKENRAGMNNLQKEMRAGFTSVNKNIWGASNAVRQDMRQMGNRIQSEIRNSRNYASQSSGSSSRSRSRGLFGKILGGVAGAASSFIPGVGPVVAPIVATAVDRAVQGQKGSDIIKGAAVDYIGSKVSSPTSRAILSSVAQGNNGREILSTGVSAALEQKAPGSSRIINSLLQQDRSQRKSFAIVAATKFAANHSGLSPEEIKRISLANSEDDLQKAIGSIAQRIGTNPAAIMYAIDYIQ